MIGAHDDETYWLTVILPNDTRIVCALPRPRSSPQSRRKTRRTEGRRSNVEDMRGLLSG